MSLLLTRRRPRYRGCCCRGRRRRRRRRRRCPPSPAARRQRHRLAEGTTGEWLRHELLAAGGSEQRPDGAGRAMERLCVLQRAACRGAGRGFSPARVRRACQLDADAMLSPELPIQRRHNAVLGAGRQQVNWRLHRRIRSLRCTQDPGIHNSRANMDQPAMLSSGDPRQRRP